MKQALSFDDVLIQPTYSEITSRLSVDTSVNIGGVQLDIPLISSPMDTVTESRMAIELGLQGGMGILHRFCSIDEQLAIVSDVVAAKKAISNKIKVAVAVGVKEEEFKRAQKIYDYFEKYLDLFCIDVANGHSLIIKEMISFLQKNCPGISIMAGNVATADGYKFLADLGVNSIRVGIGSGSICATRIQTGIGIPLLQTVLDCATIKTSSMPAIIADGGIKYPADLCKSLVAGADAVICGGIFAGTKEAPGEIIYDNNKVAWKKYRGAASKEIQEEKRGGMKSGVTSEGVSTLIQYNGSLDRVITDFVGGLRSSMSYLNARTLKEYINRPDLFVQITENGIKESHAYGTRQR